MKDSIHKFSGRTENEKESGKVLNYKGLFIFI